MNKQKFVEYLRAPESLDEQQFDEFKQLLVDHPYFSIAKSIAARAAKNLNDDSKGPLISSAAIYATDRKRLKKYISGDLIFLTDKPQVAESEPEAPKPTKSESKASSPEPKSSNIDVENLKPPAPSEVDQILDELEHDMEELRKSRMHFAEIQSQLDAVDAPQARKDPKPAKEEPAEVEKSAPVVEEKAKEEKAESLSGLMIDLEALKKEFEQEETDDQSKQGTKESAKAETPVEKPAPEVTKSESPIVEDEEEEISIPPPTPPRSKNVVTNMSEDEENDDNEPGYFDEGPDPEPPKPKPTPRKKRPARADRDSRMKVKRSELDQLMGLKSIPKPKAKEEPEEEKKAPEKKKPAAKKIAPKTTVKKTEEKPAAKPAKKKVAQKEEEKPEKKTKAAPKKKATPKKEVTESTEEKETKSTTTARASSKKTAAKKKEEAKKEPSPKKAAPKKESTSGPQEDPGNDPVTRATRKALLDFGKAEGLSMSVSRASPSKRRRKSKGKSEDGGPAKKDDDDSGGASTIIDKFIEDNPSISRKAAATSKEDLSEKSTSWQDDVASEYLAEIYLKQGNKARAKKIYQALSLKFPEKKSYFAGLIQKLEE